MAESAIKVGVSGNKVWVRVIGKGNFQNSTGLKRFVTEMVSRGKNTVIFDLEDCLGMDSTFMGTLAGTALKVRKLEDGVVHVIHVSDRNRELLTNLGLDRLLTIHSPNELDESGDPQVIDLKSEAEDSDQHSTTIREAHEALVEADPENLDAFKDVLDYLKEDIDR